MSGRVLVYGATGFSGRAIAERLRDDGHDVVLAGREKSRLRACAEGLGLPFRAFSLDDTSSLEHGLADVRVVMHAAGPFLRTAAAMIEACVRTGTHYLDLAGEWPVFALAQRRGPEAAAAGVMLMPGVGFSIVVSDCLLAHAVRQAGRASLLRVAISRPEIMSRGTLRSALGLTSATTLVRRGGTLRRLPAGRLEAQFDFGEGGRPCVAVSWPDVVTGQHTTGVPDIEAYVEAGWVARLLYRGGGIAADLVGDEAVRRSLAMLDAAWPAAPSPAERQRATQAVVVEVVDEWRRSALFRLRTLDGYTLTTETASAVVARVLLQDWAPGFQTPAGLYGPGLISGLGCVWQADPKTVAASPR